MISIEFIQDLLIVSIIVSAISCAFVQKTKALFPSSKFIIVYSLFINLILSIIFCYSFTELKLPVCLWTGFFAFIGADTIYKSLEGKLPTYTEKRANRLKK